MWINVNEKLPPDYHEVIYFAINEMGGKEIMVGHREKGVWLHCCMFYCSQRLNHETVTVTHWRELPDYPTAETLFRPHRGSLRESMEFATNVKSLADLKEAIGKTCGIWTDKVDIEPYCHDKRVGWDTHLVKIWMDNKWVPIGFMNMKPEWEDG